MLGNRNILKNLFLCALLRLVTVWQLNCQKMGKRDKAKGEKIKMKIKEKNKIKEIKEEEKKKIKEKKKKKKSVIHRHMLAPGCLARIRTCFGAAFPG